MASNAQTIEELEAEIAAKKKQLESPFAEVGNAVVKRGPGRPPGSTNAQPDFEEATAAHEQRLQQIKRLPENATEEESREHFQKEIYSILPDIAANIKWNVKFGGSKERADAETKALRILGLENKDIGNIGKGGQIIINMNGSANTLDIPMLKRPVMQTVEAMATVPAKKDGKP